MLRLRDTTRMWNPLSWRRWFAFICFNNSKITICIDSWALFKGRSSCWDYRAVTEKKNCHKMLFFPKISPINLDTFKLHCVFLRPVIQSGERRRLHDIIYLGLDRSRQPINTECERKGKNSLSPFVVRSVWSEGYVYTYRVRECIRPLTVMCLLIFGAPPWHWQRLLYTRAYYFSSSAQIMNKFVAAIIGG